ncbi:chondroitin sulfate proteoglycan 4-like [Megalops cyprinoides]|uniref:chondroitin sulfate proteoglycan 4-like n=1 Tax=Megalops cyprinoides TaxID=118141 RepID=UPI00186488CD|nr:chondroitin sulfate proteoglycan 4-like [Megalops cyprinoides]
MRSCCLAVFPLLLLLCLPVPTHSVSYFGDSFCRIQVTQDVPTFQLSLQFKTVRRSALLFLAGGVQDYLVLELYNGRLQVRMNTGSGELVLSSSLGLQLNNLLEHSVTVTLQDSKLTMLIDELFSTYLPISQTQDDLSIDLGFYLGGTGDMQPPYLDGSIPPLRGCMSDVKFESQNFDLLQSEPALCHNTKEGCSTEFEAGDGEATSFISPDSFVSFPTWSVAPTRTLELLMKTTIEDALLVFHAGRRRDFFALGVVGGYLKGAVDLGGGAVILDNPMVQLDDDQWHRINVQMDRSVLEITVDSQVVSVPLSSSEKLDLTGSLYFGGIEGKMRDVYRESGLLSRMEEEMTSESFIGCLGEIKVNKKDRSLQDALVTKDVHVKCEGEDYDYSSYYDGYETSTSAPPVRIQYVDLNPNERHCYPTPDTPPKFQNLTRLLDITPLLVPEGGEAFLDLNSLSPMIDLHAVGIQLSQIIFTLKNDPWYGLVDMNISNKRSKKFTLLDVVNKKIKYLHDGNEKYGDQIQLEVVTNGNNDLPDCLKMPQQYVLPVEVIPVNDIPQLGGGDIKITEYGRTRLSPNLIKIVDSDTRCDEMRVRVASEPSIEEGYLENAKQPGKSIKEFTCRQLKDGNIYYVHKGGMVAGLTLQVSDGHSISQSATFSLSVTQPRMSLVANTGLLLPQGGSTSIGVQQLSVYASPRNGYIVYNVTQPLRFGELQILTSDSITKQVTSFQQSDIEQERLRYISTDSNNQDHIVEEHIQFDVHLGQLTLRNNTFVIRIIPSEIQMVKMVPLMTEMDKDKSITQRELEAAVKGKTVNAESMTYTLMRTPILGSLHLLRKELMVGDSFTQMDLWNADLYYSVSVHSTVDLEDQFQFRVSAENHHSPVYTYPIHILANTDVPLLTNERLIVLDNGENILNKDHLWVQTKNSTDFVYRVIEGPRFGRLIRDSPPGQPRFEGAIKVFSNEDLLLDRLIYQHDGSESSEDEFTFLAFKQARGSTSDQLQGREALNGVFRISIQSRNEHIPVRVVDNTLHVARNGQRLLTTDVILFRDDDTNFNDTQLVFTPVDTLSGNIVSADDSSQPLSSFTQADLKMKKVLFVHQGDDSERFQLQVFDGLHKTIAMLQIHAAEPYLRVVNNTMVVVDHGKSKALNTSLLSAESNMDIRDLSEIIYEVTSPPSNGIITVSGIEASSFTQEHLRKGVVSYLHNDLSLSSKDSFSFMVRSKGLTEDGTFRIKIFKQGYLSQPDVLINEDIISYEGEHTEIDQDHLKVEQVDILPLEMVYTIKEPPRLGHVVLLTNSTDGTSGPRLEYIRSFSQEDINTGHVIYVSTSTPGRDVFSVDVSNGFTAVEGLRVMIQVVPRLIPVQNQNFTVREGGTVALSAELLNISHPFYSSANIDFVLDDPPQHGHIRYQEGDRDPLSFFTWDEVKQGLILYLHDGTETTSDSFTITASAFELERHSIPIIFGVTVLPVNDQPPKLTRNTGVELLAGEDAEVTRDMLNTEDADTPPEKIVYSVESSSNGIVALKESPNSGIQSFTQAQINNGLLMFLHNGSESGGFNFTVMDGVHTSPLHSFVVTVRQLLITMETQGELLVFPGTRQAITGEILRAVISEDGDEVSYTVLRPPLHGRLISINHRNQSEEVSSFTQTQLDSGSILYEHHLPAEPFWVTRDSAELLLSCPPAQDLVHILPITVSYLTQHHNGTSQLWKNSDLNILEGQTKVIDSSILDASNLLASVPESERETVDILFEVIQFPAHGQLTLGSLELETDAPYFSQEDLDRGELRYVQQDPETSGDSFSFRVYLNPHEQDPPSPAESGVVIEETLSISIVPRGYSLPELGSLDLQLEVLQGSTTLLTQQNLIGIDEVNTPGQVLFTVTQNPSNGLIIDLQFGNQISQFTQEDVSAGRVAFVSDGTLSDGFMEFIMSYRRHQTAPQALHFQIMARTLLLLKAENVQVTQGDDDTLITESTLKASTGGPKEEEVIYTITSFPKYAVLTLDQQPTSVFSQREIQEGRVGVHFVTHTSPRDSMTFVAHSRAANVSGILNITVMPLVNLPDKPLLPKAATVLVDSKLLDASVLANKTKAEPTFSITQPPRSARVVRLGEGGEAEPVSSFSQTDVMQGRIALEVLNNSAASDPVQEDEVHFFLTAHGVPPAEAVLSFRTAPYNSSENYKVTVLTAPSGSPPSMDETEADEEETPFVTPLSPRWRGSVDETPEVNHTSPHLDTESNPKPVESSQSNLWAILIPILLILLLLILAAILVYYLLRRNKTGKHHVQPVSTKPKNGELSQETFRKTDSGNSIPMSDMDSKEPDPELLQHCRTTDSAPKKSQYWV